MGQKNGLIDKKDLLIERKCGSGPGGQRKNKVATCVRITHKPTGISVQVDSREQGKSLKMAVKELERRLVELKASEAAAVRKGRRDRAIKNEETIRTYDFQTGLVHDHRTGKKATIKQVLGKGNIQLISPTIADLHE